MKRNLKGLCILLSAALLLSGTAAAESGSWSQINQSIARGENWQRYVTDPADFQLGSSAPLEGHEGLSIQQWGEYPSVDGSTVCVPLAMELARQWLDLPEEDLNGFVNFSTTPYAYDRLTRGLPNPMVTIASRGIMMDDTHPIDLVLGTGPNADEKKAAEDAGVELVMTPVCYDAFVFLVNSENPVESLTADQIRGIYTGVIARWEQVGGLKDALIAPFQRPHGSGSQTAMEELVMDGYELKSVEENYISEGMSDLIAQIGNYDNSRNAIGYSYLYYVDSLYKSGGIKVLAVDGVPPTPENLRSGAYPFTVYYYAVYARGNENAQRFVNWLVSDEGQACVAQAGYVPLH
ncbi:MAG: substrate-binding domain-containing protein [Clostridia bacterium]|nr:substrate-binding domain-containing protein [Clostridia bacterium]